MKVETGKRRKTREKAKTKQRSAERIISEKKKQIPPWEAFIHLV